MLQSYQQLQRLKRQLRYTKHHIFDAFFDVPTFLFWVVIAAMLLGIFIGIEALMRGHL